MKDVNVGRKELCNKRASHPTANYALQLHSMSTTKEPSISLRFAMSMRNTPVRATWPETSYSHILTAFPRDFANTGDGIEHRNRRINNARNGRDPCATDKFQTVKQWGD